MGDGEMARDEAGEIARVQITKSFPSLTKGLGFVSPESTERPMGSFNGGE